MKLVNTALALILSGQTFARDPKPIPERFTATTDDEGNLKCFYARNRVNDNKVVRCRRQLAKFQEVCDAQEKRKWRQYCNAIPAKREECESLSPIEKNRYREIPCCRQPDGSVVKYKPHRGWTCTENGVERVEEENPSTPAPTETPTEALTDAPAEEPAPVYDIEDEEVMIWDNENFDLGDPFMSKPDPENPFQWYQDASNQILYTYGFDTRFPSGAGGRNQYERLSPDLIFDEKIGRESMNYLNTQTNRQIPGCAQSVAAERTSAILAPINQQQQPIGAVLIYPTWLQWSGSTLTKVYIHTSGIGPDVSSAVECVCRDCSVLAAKTAGTEAPYAPLEFICDEVVTSASAVQIQVENEPGHSPKYLSIAEVKFGATGAQLRQQTSRLPSITQSSLRPYSEISQAQVNFGEVYATVVDPSDEDSWHIHRSSGNVYNHCRSCSKATDGILPSPEERSNYAYNNADWAQLVLPISNSEEFNLVMVYPRFDPSSYANSTYTHFRVFVHDSDDAYPEGPNTDQAVVCRAREIYYETTIRNLYPNPMVFECDRSVASAKSIQIRNREIQDWFVGEVTVGNYN